MTNYELLNLGAEIVNGLRAAGISCENARCRNGETVFAVRTQFPIGYVCVDIQCDDSTDSELLIVICRLAEPPRRGKGGLYVDEPIAAVKTAAEAIAVICDLRFSSSEQRRIE